ncbi:MAG: acyltransferase [Elusimicrobia bacterium]|nr:acyltransferase [Elusimicrobiota bacterium]
MAQLTNYRKFLRSGYTLKELGFNFFRLMVWSRLMSALKHSFAERGRGVVIDSAACVQGSRFITIGDGTWVQRYAWLTVPLVELPDPPSGPTLRIGRRVQIGPRTTLSAAQEVVVEDDVLFAMNVYVADHIHAFEDVTRPVKDQGLPHPGRIRIGRGAWIGANVVIVANGIDLEIGEGAVVGANSVVTKSIPAHCVAAGQPARVVKQYDAATRSWTRG